MDCRNHPGRSAPWVCPKCGSMYCAECMLRRQVNPMTRETVILCPVCLVLLDESGVMPDVTPYWRQMTRFFLYPLQLRVLLVMALLAAGFLLARTFAFSFFLMRLSMFILAGMMVKYAFDILRATADGQLEAPEFRFEGIFQDLFPMARQAVVYSVMIGCAFFFRYHFGVHAGIAALILVFAVMPAQIILVGAADSLFQALNPATVFQMISRIGLPYFGMAVILLFLGSASGILTGLLAYILPVQLLAPLGIGFWIYYFFVSYHLMGYMMLQFSREIGYQVDLDRLEAATRKKTYTFGQAGEGSGTGTNTAPEQARDPNAELKTRMAALVQDGKLREALEDLEAGVRPEEIRDADLARRYYELVRILGMEERRKKFMPVYLGLLAETGDREAGMSIYAEMSVMDSGISPAPAVMHRLAGWLHELRRYKEALQMARRAVAADPGHPEVPETYFRVARIYYDGLLETDNAVKVLQGLVKQYPDHPVAGKAEAYLHHIGR